MRVYNSWSNVIGWSGDSILVPGGKIVTLEEGEEEEDEEKEEKDLDGSHGREIYKSNFKQKKNCNEKSSNMFFMLTVAGGWSGE